MASLVIVSPLEITDTRLVSSNLPESDKPAWSSSTTYAVGEMVYLSSTHRVYKSAIPGNLNKPPATSPNEWTDFGPTNRWAPFDGSIGSQAVAPDGLIEYKFKLTSIVSYFGLLNLIGATEVNVKIIDPVAGEVYNKTADLRRRPQSSGWWNWFFGDRTEKTQVLFNDLPPYKAAEIYITINGGESLALGVLIFGQPREFSYGVQSGARIGIQDHSRKERTIYGDFVIVERAFSKRANYTMLIDKAEVDPLANFLAKIRATPALWVGSNGYESTTIYGFSKNWEITISYPEYSVFELELEGLT